MSAEQTNNQQKEYPITLLPSVTPKLVSKLMKLGITTIMDACLFLPYRYEDRTRITPIKDILSGEKHLIEGIITSSEVIRGRKKRLLLTLEDSSSSINITFFNFFPSQVKNLTEGKKLLCYGEVKGGFLPSMVHPEYNIVPINTDSEVEESLTPVYPLTQGVTHKTIRKIIAEAIRFSQKNADLSREILPQEILKKFSFPTFFEAISYIHSPPPDAPLDLLESGEHISKKRLSYEELLTHNISLKQLRQRLTGDCKARPITSSNTPSSKALSVTLVESLPFNLTNAQQRVLNEITNDLKRSEPMLRLVQGDVGSGKTIVAAIAASKSIESGLQVAIMAPTELLAEQHYRNFNSWFSPLNIKVNFLSGKTKAKEKRSVLESLEKGDTNVIIGTHALFQNDVKYNNLGLVIIDEQHRFGVHQRMALKEKGNFSGKTPHQLIMTATPIPRTLSMIAYADLDTSIIDELPPGRKPIITVAIPNSRRDDVISRVKEACNNGMQVYWVCTLIDESEKIECEAAEESFKLLQESIPEVSIGLVHGRMKTDEKDFALTNFSENKTKILVATTVIEVGVDVPNASLMIIENAERLGLAQLHQLRGRVGRGAVESKCVLMYKPPLSQTAKKRLGIMRDTNDGFVIAQKDLEIRGPGEVLGTRQAGDISFKVSEISSDSEILKQVLETSDWIINSRPDIIIPLIERWLGDSVKYGDV